jgi:hypothetical protein
MSESTPQAERTESKTYASVAGVSGGTVLVGFANSLAQDNPGRLCLLLAAPTVSISLSLFWLWCQTAIVNYWLDRKIRALTVRAIAQFREAFGNPNISEQQRELINNSIQALEFELGDRDVKLIRALTPVTAADFSKAQAD